jgi:pyruvate dehydrogenase E2 component (dihydrolipoamide acetyltransferase)
MATAVTIPNLGDGEAGAVLIRFLVPEGATVKRGDPLYELDTDKVTQEVEAEADGTLLQVVATEGGEYPAGTTIAWIGQPGERV